jgi:nitrile hydratase subunit beta
MSRLNDVGGLFGFGDIPWDPDAPTFKRSWEAHVYALLVALVRAGHFTVDDFRHAMERIPPGDYYGLIYYGRWLFAIELLLKERGVLDPAWEPEPADEHEGHTH